MLYSLEFYKKVDNGDLGSITVIDGFAEDQRNFLAGEISGSFEKCTHSAISDFISVVNFLRIPPQFLLLFILWKLKSDVPGVGRHPGTKQVLRLPPK